MRARAARLLCRMEMPELGRGGTFETEARTEICAITSLISWEGSVFIITYLHLDTLAE